MNNRQQAMLNAIKNAIISKQLSKVEANNPNNITNQHFAYQAPFETYFYQNERLPIEYQKIEQKIEEQIMYKFNQYLFQQQKSRLLMELFTLEKSISIHQSEVQMLKMQLESQTINEKQSIQFKKNLFKAKQIKQSHEYRDLQVSQVQQSIKINKQDVKLNKLAIFPCVRVDLQPESLPKSISQRQGHPKSYRQLNAIYTKRSLAVSNDHPNLQKQVIQLAKTVKPENRNTNSKVDLEQRIYFLERAWKNARKLKQKQNCRQYKAQILKLINLFWET